MHGLSRSSFSRFDIRAARYASCRHFGRAVGGWALAASFVVAGGVAQAGSSGDVVLDWNELASGVLVANEDLQNPGMASRSMAMMNLAIYDSLALTGGWADATSFYGYDGLDVTAKSSASGDAAAAVAAYTVLSGIYGDQQATLDAGLSATLSGIADGAAKTQGVTLGQTIGQAILDQRSTDGYDTYTQYTPTCEVGHWQPDPVNPDQEAWGPAWGEVQMFAIDSAEAFLPAPMPELTSVEYAEAYNEVLALGGVDSTVRTDEQTEIGIFWAYDRVGMGTPMTLFNDVLRTVAEQEGNTTAENAQLFAKATVAMADAGIVAWNSKFEYDLWRPVTGIRDGDLDDNPLTEAVADWTPLGAPDGESLTGFTPPFPTYLSGHATFGGALFGALQEFYGTDDITFTLNSAELEAILEDEALAALYGLESLADAERTFTSFSEAMAENGRSRVYLGIHWNFDDTEGQATGQLVASSLFHNAFVASAVPEPVGSLALVGVGGLLFRKTRRAAHLR
ncbi:MAG: vanadium-dependent haloperoxidase [Planctomycetota bacterium]